MSPQGGQTERAAGSAAMGDGCDVTVVMPCLDEAATLAGCIAAALSGIAAAGVRGEVVVADNGSADDSVAIAERSGARVVVARQRGYGAALQAGCEAARGRWIVMGDADASYDFTQLEAFVAALHEGAAVVVGDRFAGGIEQGAMPWSHRHIGNPVLSALGRVFFHSKVRDFHCGLRAFTREAYDRLGLTATGMEFASEMIAKASLYELPVAQVPVVLRRDGRDRPPHLRTWRDGWRHLRFMLLFSPRWLFLFPGIALFVTGALGTAWLVPGGHKVGGVGFDINTLLVCGFLCVLGYQGIVFAAFASVFAVREGLHPPQAKMNRLFQHVTLETGLLLGALAFVVGGVTIGVAAARWAADGFPALDPRQSMRVVIPAVVVATLGVQTIFSSFFLSMLGIPTRSASRPGD